MKLLDEALRYAAAGIPVFPLHWIKQDGNCSCRQGAMCQAKGKHPRIKKRYLCFQTFEQIAVDMGFSIDNIFKIHCRALKRIAIPQTLQ